MCFIYALLLPLHIAATASSRLIAFLVVISLAMVHAKSLDHCHCEAAALKELVLQRALEYYEVERKKQSGEDGARKCCRHATDDYLQLLRVEVLLNHGTLINRYDGHHLSNAEAHSKFRLIQPRVARKIIDYSKEV